MNVSRLTGGTHYPNKQYERSTSLFMVYYAFSDFCEQLVQQSLGQQVSQPVAQIIAGFSKVFVGEIVEKGKAFEVSIWIFWLIITWPPFCRLDLKLARCRLDVEM